MKPVKITWSESKESVNEIGLRSWRKAGVEIELEDGSVEEGFEKARKIVSEALYEFRSHPDYMSRILSEVPYGGGIGEPNSRQQLPEIDQKKQDILDILNDPTTILSDLENGKLITAIMKYGLVKEYNEKKKQLQS